MLLRIADWKKGKGREKCRVISDQWKKLQKNITNECRILQIKKWWCALAQGGSASPRPVREPWER